MNKRAFSLQELLIVIVIIAIMTVILITGGLSLRRQADVRAAQNTLAVLSTALDIYYDAISKYPLADYLNVDGNVGVAPYYSVDDKGFRKEDLTEIYGDSWINPEPDVVKANYQASIEALYRFLVDFPETAELLDSIPDRYLTAKNSNGDVIMLGQRSLIRIVDPWGNPYRYAYEEGYGVAVIESAGPDGKFAITPADDEGYNLDNISY
jgi:prepilin-type N-terminal cleavage/methylation domain-containing protein